jgi:hypothetical protein
VEKDGVIKAAWKEQLVVAVFIFWILGLPIAAQASGKKPDGDNENAKVDYSAANREILQFESVINKMITSTFSSSPFAVVHMAKGAYLEGYGIVFNFTINIHTAVISTPFGQFRTREENTPELKKRRIEELKEKLIWMLQDNGEILRQLRKKDTVTIIAYFEDRNFPDEPNENKTILLSALKKDLDELGHKNNRLKEFKQRMKIIEY